MKSTFIAIIFLLCLTSVSPAAQHDTSLDFSTIETPHCSIHFHQGLETVARKAAVFAEEAHGTLVRQFSWEPGEKTEIVLIDDSDFANGFATALPYNMIYIQVVPPSLMSTLGEYDDWLKSVITHEYAHIVTLDPSRGYWSAMRSIFGKPVPGIDPLSQMLFMVTAPPNSFLPRWWHEGMATWSETEFGMKGRGRSRFYDMVFRMAVAENNFPTIAQINGDVPEWPSGNLPYLYGYRLQQYIADTYGKDALGKLNLEHAGRFPYFISAPPQDLTGGKSYRELYDDMVAELKREQLQHIETLSAIPFTPLKTISNAGEILTNPRFSPDGSRIAFTRRDPHDHSEIVITDNSGSKIVTELRRRFSDGGICWAPDGGSLYFTQAEINSGFNVFQDLYSYDLANDKTTRLTNGQRLGDVDLSPDGKRFAAVANSRGSQNLVLLDLAATGTVAAPRQITNYSLQRVSSPRWSPDGRKISFILKGNNGESALQIFDVATAATRTLFKVNHTVEYPVWSRDGSALLYVSDETGVFNLFAFDLEEEASYQVTHLLGGAFQPDISPDGKAVIFSSYNSSGFSIVQIDYDESSWVESERPALIVAADNAKTEKDSVAEKVLTPGDNETQTAASPYSSLRTAAPHFWLPRISGDGSSSPNFGLFTAGSDVLGYHAYSLSADYGSARKRGYFNLAYQNDYFYPTLILKAHSEPLLYANLLQRGDYYELNQGLTLGISIPVNYLESRYFLSAGYQLRDERALSALNNSGLFNGISVFQGRRDNLFAGLSFDNVLRYPFSISSEEGRRASLLYRRFGRELGNDQEQSEYSAEYQEYLRLPFSQSKHQLLYLRLAGAVADNSSKYSQKSFQIGGIPSDLNPYPLRGYPARSVSGTYVATGTLEYRTPLFYPMHGPGTVPFFTEKVHGALFVDAGEVWDKNDTFSAGNVNVGMGVELRMDVTLGYALKVTPALGFARGVNAGGESQVYFTVYVEL
jgi:dipeptidyl aminopeptidase/acylaminoacyl peptidase